VEDVIVKKPIFCTAGAFTRSLVAKPRKRSGTYVSWVSPIATAVLNASVVDVVTMRTPRGTEALEIVAIHYDDLL
jgi:transcription elongation GreA/GreB family factor